MNRRLRMKQIKQMVKLNERRGLSYRQIGNALGLPKSTVSDYLRRFKRSGLSLADVDGLSDRAIFALLFPENKAGEDSGGFKPLPDFTVIHQELRKKHVTRQLLWEEYRQRYPDGYGYTSRLIGMFYTVGGQKGYPLLCDRCIKPEKRCSSITRG